MTDVDDPWKTSDVTKMTDTDLIQERTVNVYGIDKSMEAHRRAIALASETGLNTSGAADRALRIYLAYLMDSSRIEDIRDEHDVVYTIPPAGWVLNDFEPYSIDAESVDEDEIEERFFVSTTPSVREMVRDVVSMDDSGFDEQAELVIAALEYVTS